MAAGTRPGRTVVITGASSGIGLASALTFARRDERVVLAARGREALDDAAAACAEAGGEVLVVPTDVADAAQVEQLAAAAEGRFGRIDVWVNNAAVAMFGRFEELPPDDVARLLAVNINGYAWGAQSALRRFRRQGFGTLVNVGSANGRIGSPLTTSYVMSKFAISALSESLRMELVGEPRIHVCTVLPAPIDTPLWSNAANHLGEVVGPPWPAFAAERVAAAVVRCADGRPRDAWVGWTGTLGQVVHQLPGPIYESVGARLFPRAYRRGRPAPATPGNLHEPAGGPARTSGGWDQLGGLPRGAGRGAGMLAGIVGLGGVAAWLRSTRDDRRG